MAQDNSHSEIDLRYQADERPPLALAYGLGLQLGVLCLSGIVLTPAIVLRAAGQSEAYIAWAVFAAVVISGIVTMIQAQRWGWLGSGYALCIGTPGTFIAVSYAAIVHPQGGVAMMATLVVISSLFQLALASRLSWFRRIFTPTVTGAVIMLVPITVMSVIFRELENVPEGTAPLAAGFSSAVTLVVMIGAALTSAGYWRLWAPVIGVVAGSLVGGWFGIYDIRSVADASWLGFPRIEIPGFDLSFGGAFWSLLPPFLLVTMVGSIKTLGDALAIQKVSWRRPRALDYRSIQGAVGANGLGNLFTGLTGTMPNTACSSSVSVIELTGVGSRQVGVVVGVLFLAIALIPKASATVLAIPKPVAAAYITVIMSMLFVQGLKIAIQGASDYRKFLVVGISFWIGYGFEARLIFPEIFDRFGNGILQNGLTAGGLTALILTWFLEYAPRKRQRLEIDFDMSSLMQIRDFLAVAAGRNCWNQETLTRLEAVSEEALATLLDQEGKREVRSRLSVVVSREDDGIVLEFTVGAPGEINVQDRLALWDQQPAAHESERDISLRLLRHLASSIRHQQYFDMDILTVRVKPVTSESTVPA